MLKLTPRQTALFEFVKTAHGDQERKYTKQPYWVHLQEVAEIVQDVKDPVHISPTMTAPIVYIEVALCHDLFEDTKCTPLILISYLDELGYNDMEVEYIVMGVRHLTDVYTKEAFPNLNRYQRKFIEAERLSLIPSWVQTVKLADMISNTSTIVPYDANFARTYIPEKVQILNVMRQGNIQLHIACCHAIYVAQQTISDKDYDLLVKIRNQPLGGKYL